MLMKCKLPVASVLVMRTIQETYVDIVVSMCKCHSAECSRSVDLLLVRKCNYFPLWLKTVTSVESCVLRALMF